MRHHSNPAIAARLGVRRRLMSSTVALRIAMLAILLGPGAASGTDLWERPLAPTSGSDVLLLDTQRDRVLHVSRLGDVWTFPLAGGHWDRIAASSGMPSLQVVAAIVDSVRDRVVAVAHASNGSTFTTWALPLAGASAWSQLPATLPPLTAFTHKAAVLDPDQQQMVFFDDHDQYLLPLADPSAWSNCSLCSEDGLPQASTVTWDRRRQRALRFGGVNGSTGYVNTLSFATAGNTFAAITPATSAAPSPRGDASIVYDPVRDRVLMFGGTTTSARAQDAWEFRFSDATWAPIAMTPAPPPTSQHAALYDRKHDRMLVFRGNNESFWALNLTSLTRVPVMPTPVARSKHSAVYDSDRDAMLMFGGSDGTSFLDDVWSLPLHGIVEWAPLAAGGTPPSGRSGHAAAFDRRRSRLLVFGGYDGSLRNDAWSLDVTASPAQWAPIAIQGPPPAVRANSAAIYDSLGDRLIVFGGELTGGALTSEAWALSLSGTPQWSLVGTGAPPPARRNTTAILDPLRNRMLIFGGFGSVLLADTWALSLTGPPGWSAVSTSGSIPARFGHVAAYDPGGDRMLVSTGHRDLDPFRAGDTYALSLAGTPTWSTLPVGPAWEFSAGAYSPMTRRLFLFGGELPERSDNVWSLLLGGVLGASRPSGSLELAIAPNPMVGAARLRWTMPRDGQARIDVFDVGGRHVATLLDRWMSAGAHDVAWTREDGPRLGAGIYFVRLRAAGTERVARAVQLAR